MLQGHENFAVAGGNFTFFQRRVPYIMMEYWPESLALGMHPDPPVSLLQKYEAAGYRLSILAFDTDDTLTPNEVHELAVSRKTMLDVFMTQQSASDALTRAAG